MKGEVPRELRRERFLLRSARAGDGPALREAIVESLPELFPWVPFSGRPHDVENLERVSQAADEKFGTGEFYVWRIWDPSGERILGAVDVHHIRPEVLKCEIGYWIRTGAGGRGLASEAVRTVLDVVWENLEAARVEASCDPRNERSCRLVERLGFRAEGILRQNDRDASGELCDSKIYALVRADLDRA